jgi:hypothetical protein
MVRKCAVLLLVYDFVINTDMFVGTWNILSIFIVM